MITESSPEQVQASETVRQAVREFIGREARLADENRFTEWEALWSDDEPCLYWVPAGGSLDAGTRISYIYDHRGRIGSRVRQWETGVRLSAAPQSRLARVIGDLEVLTETDGSEFGPIVTAKGSFVLVQYRDIQVTWAGTVSYTLRQRPTDYRLLKKVVDLVNREAPIPTLSFIL